jgi:Holliday junction resolvase
MNVGLLRTKDGRYISTGLPKGFPDLFAVKDGRAYFIEVKIKPNTPSKEQEHFIELMQSSGCTAGVVYSVDEAVALVLG